MNHRIRLSFALLGLSLAAALPASAAQPSPGSASAQLQAAVNHASRPAADKARDADRKPGELIELTGLHEGSKVAEILPGGGYFTRIFSRLVGPGGAVYAWVPMPAANAPAGARDFAAPMRQLAAEPGYGNVKVANLDPAQSLPEQVDLVWTSLNYHDLRGRPGADLAPTNRMVFNALKPGGLYMVIDHAAAQGSGARDATTLHRIDADLVKQEVTAAGFTLVMESDLLRHAADDRTKPTREIDRGKTDQFVLLFQKPAA